MAGNPSFADTLSVTTLDEWSSEIQDNITGQRNFLAWIIKQGFKREMQGGAHINERLLYTDAGQFGSYSGSDPININFLNPFTAAQYAWKQYAGPMQVTGLLAFQNSGSKHMISDAVADLLEAAMVTARKSLNDAAFGDGTGNGGKDLGGLQLLIQLGSYTTVGGIDSNAETWWRNQYVGTVGSFAANGIYKLDTARIAATRQGMEPDLYITDANGRVGYEQKCLELKRDIREITEASDLGLPNVAYAGKPLVNDVSCPAGKIYGLCSEAMHWNVGKGYEFSLTPMVTPINQDLSVRLIRFYGNLSTRYRQGLTVADGITYP